MEDFTTTRLIGSSLPSGDLDQAICAIAEECRELARQIQVLLREVRPKDPKSKWHVVRSALRKRRGYDKEILTLTNSLNYYRGQLTLQLSVESWADIKHSLEDLVSTSKEDSRRLVQLQRQVEELRQSLATTCLPENHDDIQRLLRLSEESFHTLVNERVIQSLVFNDMYGRFDEVAKAHYNTFAWIFYGGTGSDGSDDSDGGNDPDGPNELDHTAKQRSYDERHDENRAKARESFISWLSSGDGIFHICGKLGSGKSTLMKFLCEDPRTKNELEKWAGDRTLVMANFFFWKPGSKLQKSMDGLIRGLLHEVLKSVPSLVPKVLPKEWKAMASQTHTSLQLRPEAIHEGFNRLIDSTSENISICFFIDGLDEYEETRQMDYGQMVDKLSSWCQKKAGSIKLCVSSREYNAFMNRLAKNRIRMQELTDKDMRLFIRDEIEAEKHPRHAEYLVDMVASKADGIFLWVALVVKEVRRLFETYKNEDLLDRERILEEIDQFPEGMEELLIHLIKTMKPSGRKRAYQTFAMMMRLKDKDFHFPLLAYAFIDNPLLETASIESLMNQAASNLREYCKGLVEAVSRAMPRGDPDVLAFCHRSIPEFLESLLEEDGSSYLQSFDAEDAISRLLLAYIRVKCIAGSCCCRHGRLHDIEDCPKHGPWLPYVSRFVLELRYEASLVKEPFNFEEQLEAALVPLMKEKPESWFRRVSLISYMDTGTLVGQSLLFFNDSLRSYYYMPNPDLISLHLGYPVYLRWKINQEHATFDNPTELALLFLTLFVSFDVPDMELRSIFKGLLDRGYSPHSLTGMPVASQRERDVIRSEFNVWELFLIKILSTRNNAAKELRHLYSIFFELFLESGADANLAVTISKIHRFRDKARYSGTFVVGKERHRLNIPAKFEFEFGLFTSAEYPDPDGDGILITLIDIINIWGLEEKEKLIRLVEKSRRGVQPKTGVYEDKKCIVQDDTGSMLLGTGPNDQIKEVPALEEASYARLIGAGTTLPKRGVFRWSLLLVYLLGLLSAVVLVKLVQPKAP
ncbi:hypothetical protein BDV59DRAFT_198972 [Aspergillus ambiguus]|uniref:uncharacterized protein n=1 Tax=Aspergillus ambiguus TaxID=176160 RepID=UPI003CCE0C0B